MCPDYPVLSYSINLTDITVSDGIMYANESTMDNITMGGSDEGEVALLIEEGLDPDRIYRVSVTAVNEVGKSTGSREVEFREFSQVFTDNTYLSSVKVLTIIIIDL